MTDNQCSPDIETAEDWERRIREKVWASECLTAGEWVYLVGVFQAAREYEDSQDTRSSAATEGLVERQPDLADGDRYSNRDIAMRMWQTFNVCGDRWFKYAAQRLERTPHAAQPEPERLPTYGNLLAEINQAAHAAGTNAWVRDVLKRAHRAIRLNAPLASSPPSPEGK